MSDLPNLGRLAQADVTKLTARQLQVLGIRQDYEAKHPISPSQEKTERMANAVPALLAHIDELYDEINALKTECGKQPKAVVGGVGCGCPSCLIGGAR